MAIDYRKRFLSVLAALKWGYLQVKWSIVIVLSEFNYLSAFKEAVRLFKYQFALVTNYSAFYKRESHVHGNVNQFATISSKINHK